jgi:hypothetical protein
LLYSENYVNMESMLTNDVPKESARDKATRKWRNNAILREAIGNIDSNLPIEPPSRIRREILAIFRTQSADVIRNYMISLNGRYKKLLKEKLRRLRMEYGDE